MKAILALFIVIAIPVMILVMLFTVVIPLLVQHFAPKSVEDKKVYPYLTSWEEAA